MQIVLGIGALIERLGRYFPICSPYLPHIPKRDKGHESDVNHTLLPQLHHADRLLVANLREGVLQGRPRVADGLPTDLLWAVEVSQRHIVEVLKHLGRDLVQTTHRQFLGLTGTAAQNKLMGHQHVPLGRVDLPPINGIGHSLLVSRYLCLRIGMTKDGRFQVRQKIEMDRTVVVRQDYRRLCPLIDCRHVDPLALHETGGKIQPLGGVMVAADGKDRYIFPGQSREKFVQQTYRLGGRYGLIVEVPRQKDPVHPFGHRQSMYTI